MTQGIVITLIDGTEFCNCGSGKRAIAMDGNKYEYCESCIPECHFGNPLNRQTEFMTTPGLSVEEQVESFLLGY
jgi:hypothetical protein